MITILLMMATWYLTKLYYTRDISINMIKLNDPVLMTAKCSRCSQNLVISKEHMRNPFYCNVCK
jgi:hypothetical protein